MTDNEYAYLVGAAKRDVTYFLEGIGMGGWANVDNIVESIDSRLFARTFVFQDRRSLKKVAWVSLEYAYVTLAIRTGVIEKLQRDYPALGFDEHNVMITANHSHNTPGGLSHYAFYNTTIQGYWAPVVDFLIEGIVKTIVEANDDMRPAAVRMATGAFDSEIPVAFNRSIDAYNRNPDVEKVTQKTRRLALDRTMTLLRFDAEGGGPIGSINWFGVHTTTVHSDIKAISSDNKGYAAVAFENRMKTRGARKFVAAFGQTTAGDVTPNYVRHLGLKEVRGPSRNDFENVKTNGGYQADHALSLFEAAADAKATPSAVDSLTWYVDFSRIQVAPEFANGLAGRRTGSPMIGVNMIRGTEEGGGLPDFIVDWLSLYLQARGIKDEDVHGSKLLFIDGMEHKFLGERDLDKILVPDWLHPGIAEFRRWFREGGFGDKSLLPYILPVQIVIIGEIAIVGIATEPTTVVGRRIRSTVEPILARRGVKTVIVGGYCNGYAGYVTTMEEYERQLYEGAHTLYGKWTCAGYQTVLQEMANELLKAPEARKVPDVRPPVFTAEELEKRAFRPKNK